MQLLKSAGLARFGALMLLAQVSTIALPVLGRASPALHGQDAPLVHELALVRELPVPPLEDQTFECVRSQVQGQRLGSALFQPKPEGDGTIGTLPVIQRGSVLFLRMIGGEPGTTITFARGGLAIVTSTDAPTTQDLAAPENTVTISWRSGNMTVSVTMAPQPGETDDGLTIRLARRVNALKKSFPENVANQP